MKTIMRFIARIILVVMAIVAVAPIALIFVECENTVIPNFLGLAYVVCLMVLYKMEDEDGILHGFLGLYKVAFKSLYNFFNRDI